MVRLIVMALVGAVIGIVLLNMLKAVIGPGLTSLIWLAIIVAVVVVIVRNLQTNRKVPDASPEARMQALTFAPDASKAAL